MPSSHSLAPHCSRYRRRSLVLPLASCTGVPDARPGVDDCCGHHRPTPTPPPSSRSAPPPSRSASIRPWFRTSSPTGSPARCWKDSSGVDQTTGLPTPLLATEWAAARRGPGLHLQAPREGDIPGRVARSTPHRSAATSTAGSIFRRALRQQAPGTSFKGVFKAHADQAPLSIYKGCTALAPGNVRIDLTQPFTGFLQALTLPAFAISSPQALAAQKRRRPEPEPRRPGRVRLRAAPGGNRPLRLQLLGTTATSRWPATRTTGATRDRSAPSTSSPTTIPRPGCRPCWTARSTATTPSRWATSTSWSSAASRSSSGTPSP